MCKKFLKNIWVVFTGFIFPTQIYAKKCLENHFSLLFSSWEAADPILVSYYHNLGLPSWLSEAEFQELNSLWAYGAYSLFSDLEKSYHTQLSRLNGGLLIDTIQKDMQRILSQNLHDDSDGADVNSPHKIRIYSAHDTTLTGLFVAMDNFNFLQPPYASAIIFELYDDSSIKLLYRNETTHEPYELRLCKNSIENGARSFVDVSTSNLSCSRVVE